MLKKILAVTGIVTVLLLTFLVPCSALQIGYDPGDYHYRQIPVPVSMVYSSENTSTGRVLDYSLTLPATTYGMTPYQVRNLGYTCTVSSFSDGVSFGMTWTPASSTGTVVDKISYTFPAFVYDVQEDNNFNDGYGNWGDFPDASLDYDIAVYQELDWVYVFEDGSTSDPQTWYQTVYDNGAIAYSRSDGIIPTPAVFVRDIVNSSFPTSEYANRQLDSIYFTHCSFEITSGNAYNPEATAIEVRSLGFDAVYSDYSSTQYHLDTTDYLPGGTVDIIFDGDVGVADLLIGPLSALIDFEIFPNFSLGSVFGILAGISLFVIVLKVFAGG